MEDNDEALSLEERMRFMQQDIAEIHAILAPLREVIESLPDAMTQLGPVIEGVKQSPVLKMIGVRL